MDAIADGHCLKYVHYPLEFLVAWEKRPVNLTLMAYQWCCAIPEAAKKHGLGKIPVIGRSLPVWYIGSRFTGDEFSITGHGSVPARFTNTFLHRHDGTLPYYAVLLCKSLEVGFRLAGPGRDQPGIHLGRASPNDQMFEAAFSGDDDEVIADAVCAWIADDGITSPGSFARCLTKRLDNKTPFSRRLQWANTRCLQRIGRRELEMSESETIRLLDRLEVNIDDVRETGKWVGLLIFAIRSTTMQKSLSSHHLHLLDKLVSDAHFDERFVSRDVEVMKLFEEAEDWERLEVWMMIIWKSLRRSEWPTTESIRKIKLTSRELLSRRPSAIPSFEHLMRGTDPFAEYAAALRSVCTYARRAKKPPSGSPPLQ